MIEELKRAQIGTLSFTAGLGPDELKRAIYIISQADTSKGEPFEFISERFDRSSIRNIEIEALQEIKDLDGSVQKNSKERAKTNYFKTLTTVGEAMDNVKLGRAVSVKRAKRSVQTLVDLLLTDESTLLGLTTLRCHDVYTHNHSVNVCVLTLALGQRLGYSLDQLTLLGLSGLFHDLGKAHIPPEVLNKSGEFTEEDWLMMRRHPVEGVKYLLRLKGINEMTIRIIKGIFEHHLNYDLSGYPKIQGEWDVSLFGRIISIVDCYDALTSSRVYNRIPYSPEKALKFMFGRRGRTFDAALLKTFINCIGIFPIGTVVLLTTGELAVVLRSHPDTEKGDPDAVDKGLEQCGINEMTIRIIKGIFEHHLNYDLSGYPKIQGEWDVSLFGRIISIVDCYDALTSSRVYNRIPYSPEKALKFMFGRRGRTFDAALLKTFINCIGIFPIGTVVLLTTGELAVVLRSHPDTEKGDRPRVKVIANPQGGEVDGEEIDLAEHDASKIGIVRTVDPTKYKVDVSKYFI